MRLALGTSYSKADLDLGGHSRVQGSYILPEASMAVAPNVYATLTGFASFGELSMRRAISMARALTSPRARPM